MTENNQQQEVDNFSVLVDKTKKVLKKHPNMSVADFVNGYLFPLFAEIRSENNDLRDSVEDLWDYIGEIPDEPLLEQIEQTFLALASYLDTVLVRAGWLGATGPSESFPTDMRDQFLVLGRKLSEVQARIQEIRHLASAGEDEDDGVDSEEVEDSDDGDAGAIEVKSNVDSSKVAEA